MASGIVARLSTEAFKGLGPKNPLKKLNAEDREYLWAFLKLYAVLEDKPRDRNLDGLFGEKAAQTAKDVIKLADRIDEDIFQGPLARELGPFISEFAEFPRVLRDLGTRLDRMLDLTGKPGRKQEVSINQLLVMASEFVTLTTGSAHDQHLADLFQQVSSRTSTKDFDGEAIRKRRERFEKTYPAMYRDAIARVRRSVR